MPRTSYGPKKCNQAWQLVTALMEQERQGTQDVQLCRDSGGQAYLIVDASLSTMGAWSRLTIEEVRESLTQHLGKSFLGLVIDQRERKSGRGAEQWRFKLKLWSTDLDKNQQQFDVTWQVVRSGHLSQEVNSQTLIALPSTPSQPDALFQQVREHCKQKILDQHSRMRLLSGEEIGVDQLYVDVWLLNRSPRTFQVSESKLLETFDLRNDRMGLGDRIRRDPGFEVASASPKLVILGKPGSGKTTFLKHLAVDWCNGKFQSNLIAVLIELRRIRDRQWDLIEAIDQELGLGNWYQFKALKEQIETLKQQQQQGNQIKIFQQQLEALPLSSTLKHGRLLVLMDGLDEVPTSELRHEVQNQLRQIAAEYPNNRLILTCRTQIIESIPVGFTSVEVADFSEKQVEGFVQNWFTASGQSRAIAAQQWQTFDQAMNHSPALKELTTTPVLLNLMCLVLQDEGEIPSQQGWLYQKGIKLLLSKWNDDKQIDGWEMGSETYRQLKLEQKEALLLEIAARKFENPRNFVLFRQEEIVTQITKFLQLANFREGIAILRAIEAQHGLLIERADELWSFSHLTFQEYLTIQWLAQLPSEQLAEKIANQQWQEAVKQIVKSQQPADRLVRLIKQAIDQSIANEPELQKFLDWVLQKSKFIQTNHKFAAIRAFYFALGRAFTHAFVFNQSFTHDHDFARDLDFAHAFNFAFAPDLARFLNVDHDFARDLACVLNINYARTRTHVLDSTRALARIRDLARVRDPELANKLEQLKAILPRVSPKNWETFQHWWQAHGIQWIAQLRQAAIEHRNIGHDWQFTKVETQQLQRYYDVNQFLFELMKIEGAVSDDVRAEIEDSLLLPWEELQRRQL